MKSQCSLTNVYLGSEAATPFALMVPLQAAYGERPDDKRFFHCSTDSEYYFSISGRWPYYGREVCKSGAGRRSKTLQPVNRR